MRFVDDPVMEDVRAARAEYMRIVTGIVTEGAWRGELRQTNPTVTALQLIGMCNWGWTWVDPTGPLSVEELAAAFVATFLDGLRATPSSEPVRPSCRNRSGNCGATRSAEPERRRPIDRQLLASASAPSVPPPTRRRAASHFSRVSI